MANLNLAELNEFLGDYFETMPPTDTPALAASGPLRLVGERVSLGDGKSLRTARGLDNIQVMVKREDDTYKALNMKDWLSTQVANGTPQQLTDKVNKLLDDGLLLHYEQGREFPTRLYRDAHSGKAFSTGTQTPIAAGAKPTLTFMQKIGKALGLFRGEKAKAYDKAMQEYSIEQYAQTTASQRVDQARAKGGDPKSSKGRLLADSPKDLKTLEKNGKKLFEITVAAEKAKTPISVLKANLREASLPDDLAEAREATKRFTDNLAKEEAAAKQKMWTPLQNRVIDPALREEKIRQQDSLPSMYGIKAIAEQSFTERLHAGLAEVVASAMDPEFTFLNISSVKQIKESKAVQHLCSLDEPVIRDMIKNNEVIDRFAHVIMTDPASFSSIKLTAEQSKSAMKNLCDHCIDPPKQLKELTGKMEKEQNTEKSSEPAKEKIEPAKEKIEPAKEKIEPAKEKIEPAKEKAAPAKSSPGMGK